MKPLLIALGLSLITLTARAELPTHEFQLDNGLDVLVREDHRAPVITVMVWFKAGSIDEAPYETGLAHVLEHMMFKGSKRLDAGEFSRTVARFGGSDNAFTSYDFTAYFQQYEASRLPLALELEAERLKNLKIDDESFRRELQGGMEERRQRTDDKPTALAWEKFQAVARPGTGYAHPIIGWRDQLAEAYDEGGFGMPSLAQRAGGLGQLWPDFETFEAAGGVRESVAHYQPILEILLRASQQTHSHFRSQAVATPASSKPLSKPSSTRSRGGASE